MNDEDPRKAFLADRQKYSDELASGQQHRIEMRILGRILTAYGVTGRKGIVRRVGAKEFTLAWLWEQHPDSPVKLITKDIQSWSLVDVFTRFSKTPIFEGFEDAVDSYQDCAVGCVFHANKLGDMVVHNWDANFKGSYLVPAGPKASYGRLIVQQLKFFLDALREEWAPMGYPLEV